MKALVTGATGFVGGNPGGWREPAMLPVPLLSPKRSSLWIGLVTPVDAGVARPLIEGLSTETVRRALA
jgi:hypothetical protein